jgi:hypothetical protein
MWRNVTSRSGDETMADSKRPTSTRAASTSARPPWMLGSNAPAEPEESDSARTISRLPWPEPPRSLRARPHTKTDGIALSRTIGGSGARLSSWFGHGVALSAAAIIGFFLMRAPRQASVAAATPPHPTETSVLAPRATPSPGTTAEAAPPSAESPRSTKPPIDVTSLPAAPPLHVAQPPRVKRSNTKQILRPPRTRPADAQSTVVRTPPSRPPSSASLGSVGNDGF